ncbi:MAG: hypothetical protein EOO75_09380 [Myxococcales bacterium]|nr:MAG: hypothetical protein EOO75_09380 [Myxococcales bacterium]
MGVEFRETMAGRYHLLASPTDERPLAFTLRAWSRALPSFVRRPLTEVEGELHAEGWADHAAVRGTLALDLLRDGTLRYDLHFRGNDRLPYRLVGHKSVRLLRLVTTMSELPVLLLDRDGHTIGRADVSFDVRHDLLAFARSWRLI